MQKHPSASYRTTLAVALVGGLAVLSPVGAVRADDATLSASDFSGHTAPVEKREENFDVPGVVMKVLVKEGDAVKAGQLIAQQDTTADEAHLQSVELIAASDLEVKAEEAQLEKDRVDLTRKSELIKTQAIAPSEYEEAKLAVTIDGLKAAHAREDHQKAQYDVAEQKAKIDQKKLFSHIDGVVSEITTHEGELAETQHPAITIVKNDLLYVEVDLPAEVVARMKAAGLQTPLKVRYKDEGDKGIWRDAKIHFIRPEADAQSNFEHVRLELPNSENRSAGLQVIVRLPDNMLAPAPSGAAARVGSAQ